MIAAPSVSRKARLLPRLLLAAGFVTLIFGAYRGLGHIMVARWADGSGIEVDWVNTVATALLYALSGAAPVIAGLVLFLRDRKSDRMEKQ
jgi:hypothetical protein